MFKGTVLFNLQNAIGGGTFTNMPRTARVALKGHVYHVLTRGINLQDIFEDGEDFRKYLDIPLRYQEKYHFKMVYHLR